MCRRLKGEPQSSVVQLDRYVFRCLKDPVPNFSEVSTHGSIVATTLKNPLTRFHVIANDLQNMDAAFLCRQRDVKILDLQLEQAGQQLGIIDLGAMVKSSPAPGQVCTPTFTIFGGESRQCEII